MKISIDLTKLTKRRLSINQYLLLLKIYYQLKQFDLPFVEQKADYFHLSDNGFLTISGANVSLKDKAIHLIEDSCGDRDYEGLAEKMKEIFPRGAKAGKWPWRSTTKDLADRLKKLDKGYGLEDYSDELILRTTEKYVNRFNERDMDSGMQICKYFIEKDGSSSLMDLLNMGEDDDNQSSAPTMIKL